MIMVEFSVSNLVARSLIDEAKDEIWLNPICTRDCLSGM